MSRHARRVDTNGRDIFTVLKAFGTPHDDLQRSGRGIADIIAWVNGAWHLCEIKNTAMSYGKKGLNETQRKWVARVNGGPIYILESPADAECLARGQFAKLKAFWPDTETGVGG